MNDSRSGGSDNDLEEKIGSHHLSFIFGRSDLGTNNDYANGYSYTHSDSNSNSNAHTDTDANTSTYADTNTDAEASTAVPDSARNWNAGTDTAAAAFTAAHVFALTRDASDDAFSTGPAGISARHPIRANIPSKWDDSSSSPDRVRQEPHGNSHFGDRYHQHDQRRKLAHGHRGGNQHYGFRQHHESGQRQLLREHRH